MIKDNEQFKRLKYKRENFRILNLMIINDDSI